MQLEVRTMIFKGTYPTDQMEIAKQKTIWSILLSVDRFNYRHYGFFFCLKYGVQILFNIRVTNCKEKSEIGIHKYIAWRVWGRGPKEPLTQGKENPIIRVLQVAQRIKRTKTGQ